MRIAPALLAILCAAASPLAQEIIEWSAERRLVKDDFRGRAPANAANASLSWLNIDAAWECQAGVLITSARATFDPSRSWWRTSGGNTWDRRAARQGSLQLDLQLLEHERLHFDIAETAARKLRRRFKEFTDACGDADGIESIGKMVVEVDRELQEDQERYDRETRHGIDARAQDRWKRSVAALLK